MKREIYTFLSVMCILLLYVGLYFLLVIKNNFIFLSGAGPWELPAKYRFGGSVSEAIFKPLHRIDMYIRYDYWHVDIEEWERDIEFAKPRKIQDIRRSILQGKVDISKPPQSESPSATSPIEPSDNGS